MKKVTHCLWALFLQLALVVSVYAQPTWSQLFADVGIKAEAVEISQWQGYTVRYQALTSHIVLSELIPNLVAKLPYSLQIQHLGSLWLISFSVAQTHYLWMLRQQNNKTVGWFSALQLNPINSSQAAFFLAPITQHYWQTYLAEQQITHIALVPTRTFTGFSGLLAKQLEKVGWQPVHHSCKAVQWCAWSNQKEQLVAWFDSSTTLWHVLMWPTQSASQIRRK